MKPALVWLLAATTPVFAGSVFISGNLVVSVEGNGQQTAGVTYTSNQAAPLSLYQFTTAGSLVNTFTLPQIASGNNLAVSGEYGSSSEGALQLSSDGRYLTLGGYGVNADAFNANPGSYSAVSTNTALAQSGSLTGLSYTPVARVAALIDSNGGVDSSTAVYNIYNGNNIRSVATADGVNLYLSGQGTSPDLTGGVFYTTDGSSSAVSITGKDTNSKTTNQDTRIVEIYNNTLYVSVDSREGSGSNRSFVGTLGAPPSTTLYNANNGPTQLAGTGTSTGKYTTTALTGNAFNAGLQINLSPEGYFFANSTTLYIADSGDGKQTSATSPAGDGGLQKWSFSSGTWNLDYTLYQGLNLVKNPVFDNTVTSGTTGLQALTGHVDSNGNVELFATNYTVNGTDQTYLYGITDTLAATTLAADLNSHTFTTLATAPTDTTFKGVSFAPTVDPVPEPATLFVSGSALLFLAGLRRRTVHNAAK